jgi:hypothetical protein
MPTQKEFEKFLDWLKTQWFKASWEAEPFATMDVVNTGRLGEATGFQEVLDYLEQHGIYQPEEDMRNQTLEERRNNKTAHGFYRMLVTKGIITKEES